VALVVYALFDSAHAANEAETAVRREHSRGGACTVQTFARAPIDGTMLPEGATEFGRNLFISMGAGAVVMTIAGAIAGAFDLLLGMGIGMGIALGFVTGLLMGLVGGMQAGTRMLKPALRSVEARLVDDRVLVIVEPATKSDLDAVADTLERYEPRELGTL
jgi:hypothetical protein